MPKAEIFGVSRMLDNLKRIAKKHPDAVAEAAYKEMQIEVVEMKKRCPVDTRPNAQYPYQQAPHPGNLRNSIHAEEPEIKRNVVHVTVATGAQAPYAIFVHENPDAFHPVGQWKFMESVLQESRPYMAARIAARIHFDKGSEDVS